MAAAAAAAHFIQVTQSYWRDLFYGYEVSGLPRTNNDLEQLLGSVRCHERRASGRKGASAGLVVRGAARMAAAVARNSSAPERWSCGPRLLAEWRPFQTTLERRSEARRRQLRFRRHPEASLAELELPLLHQSLPP